MKEPWKKTFEQIARYMKLSIEAVAEIAKKIN